MSYTNLQLSLIFRGFPSKYSIFYCRLEDILAEDAIEPLMAPWLREQNGANLRWFDVSRMLFEVLGKYLVIWLYVNN